MVPKKKAVTVPALTSLYRRTVEGKYICPHCNAEFTAAPSVKTHIENSCKALFPAKKPRDLPPSKEASDNIVKQRSPAFTFFFLLPLNQLKYKDEVPFPLSPLPPPRTPYGFVISKLQHASPSIYADARAALMTSSPFNIQVEFFCNTQGRYECPHCDSDFTTSYNVKTHLEKSCTTLFPDKKKARQKAAFFAPNHQGRFECTSSVLPVTMRCFFLHLEGTGAAACGVGHSHPIGMSHADESY